VHFLFPLFLIAGLTLLIPILIHLFNLRKYKTVLFPHTRFLKNLQLHSRKQSQVQYKWLLAIRLMFLAFLIFAFAQPYWRNKNSNESANRLHVIYIDNSYSMSVQSRQRSLLDRSKENAVNLIRQLKGNFIVLNNEKLINYKPLSSEQALEEVYKINFSSASKTSEQVINNLQNLLQDNITNAADLFYISDFQKNVFASTPDTGLLHKINFSGLVVQNPEAQNIYIDSAFFETPVLQTGQSNKLIVRSKYFGKAPNANSVLQFTVNGQLKSAVSPVFNANKESNDTLTFQVNDAGWQRLLLTIGDASAHFDDSFRIAARNTPDLSVLVLNETTSNAYIQAALRSYSGFKATQTNINNAPQDWTNYNLILVNGLAHFDKSLADKLKSALDKGQNVCIFPAAHADIASLNMGLRMLGDIQVTGIDTSIQTIATLQFESRLVKDMFEHIPDNVQMPIAKQHYIIRSGLSANQQSVFSFRNGDPFFASYTPSLGQLYMCSSSAELQSGNFPASYFFLPFLYQMASLAKGGSIFAVSAGQKEAVFVPNKITNNRNMIHVLGNGLDVIPAQRAEGMGVYVFLANVVQQPDFYKLTSITEDTTLVAINANRIESNFECWTIDELQKQWKGKDINWQNAGDQNHSVKAFERQSFPLWKLCTILALLMLGIETYFLSKNLRNKKIITS
jgi:hypothetical protein